MVVPRSGADGHRGFREGEAIGGNSSGAVGKDHPVGSIDAGDATDGEIVRTSLEDPQAFGEIFDRHASTVHRFLSSHAGVDVSEDLLSEVFLTAFRGRKTYDDRFGTVVPWLLGIASNVLRHHYRSEGRRSALLSRLGQRSGRIDGVLDDIAADVERRTEIDDVEHVVDAIEVRYRDALILYAAFDLSYEEVAQSLNVRIGTVRSRISRGRTQLRELLACSGQYQLDEDRSSSAASSHEGPMQ